MTVISSVYKDDDVKCHNKSAQALSVQPFLWYITLPNHMVLFVLFFSFASAFFFCFLCRFYLQIYSFLAKLHLAC